VLETKAWLLSLFPEFSEHDAIIPAISASGEDLQLSPELRKLFPYSIECKRTEGLAKDYAFMEQAEKNAGTHTPLVIMRSNNKEALVMIKLKDFSKLVGI
jgi:hypothetical protein